MDTLILLFAASIGVAALLAAIAIWAPRATPIRATAVLVTALFIPLAYLGLTEILSQPKPMGHEWFKRHVDEATILGVSIDEGKAIYLWLRLDRSLEPRYYKLPWRMQLAEKLQNLIDEAIKENATVKIKSPFSRKSFDDLGDLNIEIILPPLPPQKLPPQPPQFFNPRQRAV
ncbi:MAG: hypothetical protein OES46_06715 [Gammaproteobacteria bacterium]|nr:hypothetical protein [Gammaproteobacteria bacterium]